jgi:putative DNA methylase
VPLVSTFMLSTKKGKEHFVQPIVEGDSYRFEVMKGVPPDRAAAKAGTSAGKWKAFKCLVSGVPVTYEHIRHEGIQKRLGEKMFAVVAQGKRGRVYLDPTKATLDAAKSAQPSWRPELEINYHPRDIKTQIYGLTTYGDLFTPRQLVALTTFSDLLSSARKRAEV